MIDTEFIDYYKKLLIFQYQDQPNAVAEITARLSSIEKTFSWLNSFSDEFDLDQAYGHRLDIIGRIVGVNRIVDNIIPKEYFGWDDGIAPNPQTFGAGKLFDLIKDTGYSPTELDDSQFRFFIRAKIAKNVTSAFLTSDERVTLQETILYLFESKAYVVDNFDMSLTIYIDESFDMNKITLLTNQNLIPKPQGVQYKDFVVTYAAEGTFGFSENPNAESFGMGKFAELSVI